MFAGITGLKYYDIWCRIKVDIIYTIRTCVCVCLFVRIHAHCLTNFNFSYASVIVRNQQTTKDPILYLYMYIYINAVYIFVITGIQRGFEKSYIVSESLVFSISANQQSQNTARTLIYSRVETTLLSNYGFARTLQNNICIPECAAGRGGGGIAWRQGLFLRLHESAWIRTMLI